MTKQERIPKTLIISVNFYINDKIVLKTMKEREKKKSTSIINSLMQDEISQYKKSNKRTKPPPSRDYI